MTELKQCPFCGGDAVFKREIGTIMEYEYYWVMCKKCGVSTREYKTVKTAIDKWNRRL